jgi:hypothetical protein
MMMIKMIKVRIFQPLLRCRVLLPLLLWLDARWVWGLTPSALILHPKVHTARGGGHHGVL